MQEEQNRVVIVGGGASGMVAAIAAARQGADVTMLERMVRVGKKLLATGNGRCNLANRNLSIESYHGGSPQFIRSVLDRFDLKQTLVFFENLGIKPVVEENGNVYPASDQASSVLEVLRYEMEQLGVDVHCNTKISRVEKAQMGLRCIDSDGGTYPADCVILAAGGKSSPNLGSNGSGFKVAEGLGHSIREPFPALVQVVLDAPFLKRLSGLRVQARAESRIDGTVQGSEEGELLFTDYGLSGIPVMQLSRVFSENVKTRKELTIHLDLFPDTPYTELEELIVKRIGQNPQKTLEMSFIGLLNKRLIGVVLKEAGLESIHTACGGLTKPEVGRIAALLKDWSLSCVGVKSWMFSQVTAGGVCLDDVSALTLESKICPGVFFAGEILDVDGDCGGYNLQWAWSSGYIAGESATKRI